MKRIREMIFSNIHVNLMEKLRPLPSILIYLIATTITELSVFLCQKSKSLFI